MSANSFGGDCDLFFNVRPCHTELAVIDIYRYILSLSLAVIGTDTANPAKHRQPPG